MKMTRIALLAGGVLMHSLAFADVSYQETTQYTGGSMMGMLKMAGAFSSQAKQATSPVTSTVRIHGGRMVSSNPHSTELIDLDQQTITFIDHEKRTYSVATFQDIQNQMAKAAAKSKSAQAPNSDGSQMTFNAHVSSNRQTRQIDGQTATEALLTVTMVANSSDNSAKGGMAATSEMWLVQDEPGLAELRRFNQRMAKGIGDGHGVFRDVFYVGCRARGRSSSGGVKERIRQNEWSSRASSYAGRCDCGWTTAGGSLHGAATAKARIHKQFGERAGLLAGVLLEAGVKPGDRVAFLGVNTHRLMEAYYGVLEAGAVLLPLNIRLAAAELSYVLNDAGATVLFVEQSFVPLAESFRDSLSTVTLFIQLDGIPEAAWLAPDNYETLLGRATPHRADIGLLDEDEVAEIFYTSGTSARPKGVMLTHRNIYLHALEVCIALQVQNGSVELHTIPLFHANGWGVPHFLTMLGGKHVMVHSFDPKEIFRLIEVEQVNQMSVVPTMATVLANHPERENYDLSSLRRIVIGGSASSPTLIREVEENLGCSCFSGYGLTETSPVLSLAQVKPELKGEERYFGQAMTGYAIPGVEMRIVNANDEDVPQNGVEFGELIARGDGIMKGYWNQPESSADAFRGGWFHTGDMATLNEEGGALIVDRKKDLIVSGGENVSSLEVERVILAHPAILDAAVIPVSDQKWGEVPKALVVLRAGASASESELIAFCRSQLAHYKCPHTVVFVDSLSKTGTGKVLKKDLRKQYEATSLHPPAPAIH